MAPTTTNEPWREAVIGRDRALVGRRGGAVMAFAVGPPLDAGDRSDRLAALLGGGIDAVRHCRQVHGRSVHRVEHAGAGVREVGDGDGVLATDAGTGLLVWTADCVPVLIAGPGVAAAVHAGWRGCAADVVGVAVERVTATGATARDLHVALGPAICGRCYEVGSEVHRALGGFGLDETRWRSGDRVDLRGFLTARLEALGLASGRIETVGGCTAESPDLASYRRDGAAAGRQWSMIVLTR